MPRVAASYGSISKREGPSPPCPCHRVSRPRASSNGRSTRRLFHNLPFLRHATDVIIRKIGGSGEGVTASFVGYFFFGLVLRSCRSADPATERTILDFEVLSNLPASRPTRLDVPTPQLLCRTMLLAVPVKSCA
jgi:hypothetical protein